MAPGVSPARSRAFASPYMGGTPTPPPLTIIYKVVGKGTAALGGMEQGQELDVLCGLGNGFDVSRCGERTLVARPAGC